MNITDVLDGKNPISTITSFEEAKSFAIKALATIALSHQEDIKNSKVIVQKYDYFCCTAENYVRLNNLLQYFLDNSDTFNEEISLYVGIRMPFNDFKMIMPSEKLPAMLLIVDKYSDYINKFCDRNNKAQFHPLYESYKKLAFDAIN